MTKKRYLIVIERGPTNYGAFVPDVDSFEAPTDDEHVVRYDESMGGEEWISILHKYGMDK